MDKIVSRYAHVMDRLAVPLIEALYSIDTSQAQGEAFARNFATLLNQSVGLGGEIAQRFELDSETQDDRMAAIVTAAKILSNAAIQQGAMPSEADNAVALRALDGVMGFAEDFIHDLNEDLGTYEAVRPADILGSGTAMVSAVYSFPFGREPAGIMSELTLGLRARMKKWMRMLAMDDQQPTDRLHMMRAGMLLLTDSYHWRVRAIEDQGASTNAEEALNDIWAQLDEKLDMLKVILMFIEQGLKGAQGQAQSGGGSDAVKPEQEQSAEQTAPTPPPPPAQPPAQPPTASSDNPMAFFVKKTG